MESTTIDQQEVAYYTELADQWWDEQGKFWPLHRLNRLRTRYLRQAICRHFGRAFDTRLPLQGLSILDIGCGGGILSESMARLGASVHGIDVVERNIHIAREHARQNDIPVRYEYVDVADLVTQGLSYDVVLNMEVVEHVADLPVFMSQCSRLVRQDGIFFIATINRNPLSWLFAIIGAEYVLRWLPIGTHRWSRFVKPAELETMLEHNGLVANASIGVSVNPFNRAFSLSRRRPVNYMLSAIHRNSRAA
jgi:2-polyprenyl-6-hydroxyphenyl methylase/3-demethylubiquinone-9 3-methyltransferase